MTGIIGIYKPVAWLNGMVHYGTSRSKYACVCICELSGLLCAPKPLFGYLIYNLLFSRPLSLLLDWISFFNGRCFTVDKCLLYDGSIADEATRRSGYIEFIASIYVYTGCISTMFIQNKNIHKQN